MHTQETPSWLAKADPEISHGVVEIIVGAKTKLESQPTNADWAKEILVDTVVKLKSQRDWPCDEAKITGMLGFLRQFTEVTKLRMPDLTSKGMKASQQHSQKHQLKICELLGRRQTLQGHSTLASDSQDTQRVDSEPETLASQILGESTTDMDRLLLNDAASGSAVAGLPPPKETVNPSGWGQGDRTPALQETIPSARPGEEPLPEIEEGFSQTLSRWDDPGDPLGIFQPYTPEKPSSAGEAQPLWSYR